MNSTNLSKEKRHRLDRSIIQLLTRHADDMLEDLFEFSNHNAKTMKANITQLQQFSRDQIENELEAMAPQIRSLLTSINFLDCETVPSLFLL